MKELERLSAPLWFKAIMVFAVISGVITFTQVELEFLAFPLILFLIIIAISHLEDYYIADHFIKKRKERILHQDIKEVRELLWWWIITDEYGDSMWINYASLTKENKQRFADWLRPRGLTDSESEPAGSGQPM